MRPFVLSCWLALLVGCQTVPAEPAQQALGSVDALEGLSEPSRVAVGASPIPVLLFPEAWSARSTVTTGPGFYAISARDGEITVSLHATDVVHHRGDEGSSADFREHVVRGKRALVLVNEGIRSVTWEEGTVSYVVDVECYRPFEDPRCTEDAFVIELASSLIEVPR